MFEKIYSVADVLIVYLMQALAAFQIALQHNPQSSEVSKKIKRLTQLAKDKKRVQEVETMRSNIDMAKHLDELKSELVSRFDFLVMISLFPPA